jgi:hypothetical protein
VCHEGRQADKRNERKSVGSRRVIASFGWFCSFFQSPFDFGFQTYEIGVVLLVG